MSGDTAGVPEPSDIPDDEEFDDGEAPPACPICKQPASEGPCEHEVSEVGHDQISSEVWKPDLVDLFCNAVEELGVQLTEAFTEDQLKIIIQLLRLPTRTRAAMVGRLKDDSFAYEYFLGLGGKVPGYAGMADCFADGGGTSSTWYTTWAQDAKKAGRWIDKKVGNDIKCLKALRRAAKKLSPG